MRAFVAALGLAALVAGAAPPDRSAAAKSAPAATSTRSTDAPARASCVVRLDLSAVITAGIADYVATGVARAAASDCAVLAILDTPGGELGATRKIVRAFLSANVPVVVFVAPRGARAGSAGMFITLAAHVAAMAPGSSIGASHPVVGMGRDPEEAGGKHLGKKIESDAAALARAIAQGRGRNVEWAEAAVRESVSATAREALANNVVDRIAADERELLATIDGTIVQTPAGRIALATRDAPVVDHGMALGQRVRSVLGNPTMIYLLVVLGLLGLVLELSNPGLIIPGVAGAIALLLAAIGMDVLPIRVGALLVMALGAALLVAEVFVTSYGLLALAGVALLGLGGSLLVDRQTADFFADASLDVSWSLVIPLALLVLVVAIPLAWRAARLRRQQPVTGLPALRGQVGRVVVGITREPGQVFVDGERWRAVADRELPAGTHVRVDDVHGLTLHVTPIEPAQGELR